MQAVSIPHSSMLCPIQNVGVGAGEEDPRCLSQRRRTRIRRPGTGSFGEYTKSCRRRMTGVSSLLHQRLAHCFPSGFWDCGLYDCTAWLPLDPPSLFHPCS